MIILDTHVISEPLRPRPSEAVIEWLDAQSPESLYLTAVNTAELWAGVARLPDGARRHALESSLENLLHHLFGSRRLAFDEHAARTYAELVALAAGKGVALPLADGMVAAIAVVHGFAVATRDARPFEAAGIRVIDPWISRA